MAQFVLLEHNHPALHWDFMLEQEGLLWTWRLDEQPGQVAARIEATKMADHRIAYLDYEGPVSNGRGEVSRADRGTYLILDQVNQKTSDQNTAIELLVQLHGERLTGKACLRQIDADRWEFVWTPKN
jgi:hypothetical protein